MGYSWKLNGVTNSEPLISFKVSKNAKDYINSSEFAFVNVGGRNNSLVSLNDDIQLYGDSARVFRGYVSKVSKNPENKLDVQCNSYTVKLADRNITEVYEHWEISQIAKDIIQKKFSEFTTTNVDATGTYSSDQLQDSQDGAVTLDGANKKYGQQLAPTTTTIGKIKIYVNASTSGVADFELRTETSSKPDTTTDGLLAQRLSVSLSAGWNEVFLSRKDLSIGTKYWLVIEWVSGSFTIDKNGSSSTGRVAYSSASPESWAIQSIDDLRFETYSTTATLLEYYRCVEKPVETAFNDLIGFAGNDQWIYYVDDDLDVHFEEVETTPSGFTFTTANTLGLEYDDEGKNVKNYVVVYGGSTLTSNATSSFTGNGTQKTWAFASGAVKKRVKSVTVNSVAKTEDTDFFVNYDTGVIRFNTAPPNTHAVVVTYDFYTPTIAISFDSTSISLYGQKEYVKTDSAITTSAQANDVASALLDFYKNPKNNIEIKTRFNENLDLNELVTVNLPAQGFNADYVIYSVSHSMTRKEYTTTLNLINSKFMTMPEVLKELKRQVDELKAKTINVDARAVKYASITNYSGIDVAQYTRVRVYAAGTELLVGNRDTTMGTGNNVVSRNGSISSDTGWV